MHRFWWENLREDHSEDLEVDESIILKWIEEWNGGCSDWIDLAQDRDRGRARVKVIMNIPVPYEAEDILASPETVSFSGRTVLDEVIIPVILELWVTFIPATSCSWQTTTPSINALFHTVDENRVELEWREHKNIPTENTHHTLRAAWVHISRLCWYVYEHCVIQTVARGTPWLGRFRKGAPTYSKEQRKS